MWQHDRLLPTRAATLLQLVRTVDHTRATVTSLPANVSPRTHHFTPITTPLPSTPILAHLSLDRCIETIVQQLMSVHVCADAAPIILTGTRKADVAPAQGAVEPVLLELSDRLLRELRKRCAPALAGLQFNEHGGSTDSSTAKKSWFGGTAKPAKLCFFPIENSKARDARGYWTELDWTRRDACGSI
jgi:hypothetical protein